MILPVKAAVWRAVLLCSLLLLPGCRATPQPATLILLNGNIYTLSWPDPSAADGSPAPSAPHRARGWKGDAQALAIRDGSIVYVGSNLLAQAYAAPVTRIIDLHGATVVPGLVDAHVHILELGRKLNRVDLVGVASESEAVDRVAEWAERAPAGSWIIGYGWDDGAWANHYPDMTRLSAKVPDHPVYLRGLHGYAVWGNRLAFEKAGIDGRTPAPAGGEIRKDSHGRPTGILLNQAVGLLERAVPAETRDELMDTVQAAMRGMTRAGYVAVHEAGADAALMDALDAMAAARRLPVRMYAMVSGRDQDLLRRWIARGPDRSTERMLTTRSVKVFFDGALGSRGARLLADYADAPGQRGVTGPENGFDPKLVAQAMKSGFQLSVHAIGDGANREALDYIQSVRGGGPAATDGTRDRIEHAQVLDARDVPRFAALGVIGTMQPAHATEDMGWAEQRLGADRTRGAYAWRTLRRAGARLVFSSDLPGTDYNVFYGLHSAITRRDRTRQPAGGWHAEQKMSPEEALRGYTTWAAYTAFLENQTGVLAPGRWADVTVMNLDPLAVGERDPDQLLGGQIEMTIVAGRIVYRRNP